MSAFSPRQMFNLDEACKPIAKAFNEYPYLVGTAASLERIPFRDVDVRLMLPDEEYDTLLDAVGQNAITFLGMAVGQYLESKTNLPVDFQFQRQTEANENHKGIRNTLGHRELPEYQGDAPVKRKTEAAQ